MLATDSSCDWFSDVWYITVVRFCPRYVSSTVAVELFFVPSAGRLWPWPAPRKVVLSILPLGVHNNTSRIVLSRYNSTHQGSYYTSTDLLDLFFCTVNVYLVLLRMSFVLLLYNASKHPSYSCIRAIHGTRACFVWTAAATVQHHSMCGTTLSPSITTVCTYSTTAAV